MRRWRSRRAVARTLTVGATVIFAVLVAAASAGAAGSQLLLYTGPGTTFEWGSKYTSFATAAGRPMVESLTLPPDMSAYSCVLLPVPTIPFDVTQRAQLSSYAAAGGTIVAIADHEGWAPGAASIDVINKLAGALGAGMVASGAVDVNYNVTTNVDPSPYTQGVHKVGLATSATVVSGAGTTLVRSTSGTFPWVARAPLGTNNGGMVFIGDANAVSDFFSMPTDPLLDNGRLVRNLCGDIRPPAVTLVTPPDGARYGLNQQVQADWFCTDLDGNNDVISQVGTVADGALIDTGSAGAKTFTVTCKDTVGNEASVTHSYIVDASPPDVVVDTPVEGATYNRNATILADWGCSDDDGPADIASAVGTTAVGAPINTVMPLGGAPLQKSYTVTCTDQAGNTGTKTVTYTVADMNPPVATITSPLEGARFPIGKDVKAGWLCTDPDGPQDIDQGASFGTLPPGSAIDTTGTVGQTLEKSFTVYCQDIADPFNFGTKTVKYYVDGNAPVITIAVPVDGGTYPRGSNQPAEWSCTDPDGDADVKTKVATVPVGTPINTGTLGPKPFSVTCTDQAGNVATKVVQYNVIGGPPVITIVTPGNNATYAQGQVVSPSYSCSDPDGDLKSCVREGGATGPVDTSKPGTFKFTVNAEDVPGNTATKSVTYTVKAKTTVASGTSPTTTTKTPAATKVCKSRRQFRIRVKKLRGGVTAVSATVFVNGKKTLTRRGKRVTAIVTLKGLKKGRYTVKINVKYSNGRTLSYTRKFKTCTPKGK